MPDYSSDRRSVLKIFGAIGATCAYPFASQELHGQTAPPHQHAPAVPAPPSGTELHFFNKQDFETIATVADLIIPATGSPGAIGAGVPAYIDLVIARNSDQQLVVADGLRWLDSEAQRLGGARFSSLNEPQQLSILEPLCEAADASSGKPLARNAQFFALIKSLTADGYYTSRIGLIEELGYKGNSALSAFPKCNEQA